MQDIISHVAMKKKNGSGGGSSSSQGEGLVAKVGGGGKEEGRSLGVQITRTSKGLNIETLARLSVSSAIKRVTLNGIGWSGRKMIRKETLLRMWPMLLR